MAIDRDNFAREWSLRWAEGVMLGFARERVERPRAIGMLRAAHRKLGVKAEELKAILLSIETSPRCLPTMSQREKSQRLRPIRDALESEEI